MKTTFKFNISDTYVSAIILLIAFFCVAQTELKFQPLYRATNGMVILSLQAPAGNLYRLRTSDDLAEWVNLTTFPVSLGICRYTDMAATFLPSRFYQATQMPDTNYIWGDHIQTEDGEVIIQPINHATFIMAWKTNILYFDPTGAASRYAHLPRATILFLTHAHSDHYSASTITNVITNYTRIIIPRVLSSSLPSYLTPYAILMTNGMTTNLNGIHIEAIPMYNLTTQNHLKGDGNGYVLTIGNKRFYISGDTEDIPEMRALKNIDVAFLAMNKPYTMSPAQAASAIREFKPKIVYPNHFSPSTPPTDFNELIRLVGNDLGIEIRIRKWY